MASEFSIERAAARMLCVGFEGLAVTDDLRLLIARGVRSVILFARNYQNREQLIALCSEIKSLAPARHGETILICVDHEGGRVQRFIDGFTRIPSMREIGNLATTAPPPEADLHGSGELETAEHRARSLGHVIASELRGVGIDLNLAPVLDVDSNPANPVIGERSFGRDPHLVARLGCAMIDAFQNHPNPADRIAACGKHFPGHGDTHIDSHFDLPRLPHDLARLHEVELVPFVAAIKTEVSCIMTAHVMFDALDREGPATMSSAVIDDLLRTQLGLHGIVISDDLEMKAIADHFGVARGALRAASAGVDLLMCCHTPAHQHAVIDSLAREATRDTAFRERIGQSCRRLDEMHARFVPR
jgi:beta-N-acetylhexosaminidase